MLSICFRVIREVDLIFRNIRKIWSPAWYQGNLSMSGYFEGWYYKFSDKNEQNTGALIPGISFNKDGSESQAFIQYLDDSGVLSDYIRYDTGQFSYSHDKAEIRIGKSFFSPAGIDVNIEGNSKSIKGSLIFKDIKPWPVSLFSPGAMGWYAFVPFMECYHGVLSFDHGIEGGLELGGKRVDFSGGRGYIEKDWGRSFPQYHIWIQTNHFEKPGTSLMVSIANIPWLSKSFDGFLIGFLFEGRLYRFTTYNGSSITNFRYDQGELSFHVVSKDYRLEVDVLYVKGAELLTPVEGEMRGRLSESLASDTKVKLVRISKGLESGIFDGKGRHTGLEIQGEIPGAVG
jgi:tocopherol cyclase